MTAVYLFVLIWGLGAWLPMPTPSRRDWFGFQFLCGWLMLIVALSVGTVLPSFLRSTMWFVRPVAAAVGLAHSLVRTRPGPRDLIARFSPPLWVLLVIVLVVLLASGGVSYLPFPGDETASWLRSARQIF